MHTHDTQYSTAQQQHYRRDAKRIDVDAYINFENQYISLSNNNCLCLSVISWGEGEGGDDRKRRMNKLSEFNRPLNLHHNKLYFLSILF